MEIKPPGAFSRGRIIFGRPAPHITPDTLLQELTHAWGPRGFEVYKSSLIGLDVALKRSGWTGLAFKIKQVNGNTEILYNAFAPSAFVRFMFMGAIPILIVNSTSWKPLLREFEGWLRTSPFFTGGQLPGQGPVPLPHAVASYSHGAPPQQQWQQPAPQQWQQPQEPPPQQWQQAQQPQQQWQQAQQPQQQWQQAQPPGQPCMQCGTPMQWVAEQSRWYCGRCQQLR